MIVWWQKGLSWQLPYETRLNVSSHTKGILKSDQVSNSNFTNEEYWDKLKDLTKESKW